VKLGQLVQKLKRGTHIRWRLGDVISLLYFLKEGLK
jgi:hypothetical protein